MLLELNSGDELEVRFHFVYVGKFGMEVSLSSQSLEVKAHY